MRVSVRARRFKDTRDVGVGLFNCDGWWSLSLRLWWGFVSLVVKR